MKNFCKGCTERYPACWGSCEKYIAAREKHLAKKAAVYAERKKETEVNAVKYTGLRRCSKNR